LSIAQIRHSYIVLVFIRLNSFTRSRNKRNRDFFSNILRNIMKCALSAAKSIARLSYYDDYECACDYYN